MFDVLCAGPGPHQPISGILGQSDTLPSVTVYCSSPQCQTVPQAAAAAASTSSANQAAIIQALQTALTMNATDKSQDQNIINQAASVILSPPTTLAAMTPVIKALAQAVTVLAQNDQNTKTELNQIIRKALAQFDGTA